MHNIYLQLLLFSHLMYLLPQCSRYDEYSLKVNCIDVKNQVRNDVNLTSTTEPLNDRPIFVFHVSVKKT